MRMPRLRSTYPERFWQKVDVRGQDECWEWQAYRSNQGYGRFRCERGKVLAHRYAWELHHGQPPPTDVDVCHSCDNPPCCNPHHLFLGTHDDNNKDREAKGRGAIQNGFRPHSKLTPEQRAEIRAMYVPGKRQGEGSSSQLGALYGVSSDCVRDCARARPRRNLVFRLPIGIIIAISKE